MDVISQVGEQLERRWRAADYLEGSWPELTAEALNALPAIHPYEVIRWAFNSHCLPHQGDVSYRFGQPPLTVYRGSRFKIDVLYWLSGTTSIHQHAFSGAFKVIAGSSIHSRFDFKVQDGVNACCRLGELTLLQVELLKLGDVRRIPAGTEFIHSLFHLDHPSVTLVARTLDAPSSMPQWEYFRPCLSVDPFFKEPTMNRQLQLVDTLLIVDPPETDSLLRDFLAEADFMTTYQVLKRVHVKWQPGRLDKLFNLSQKQSRLLDLMDFARQRHGPRLDRLIPTLEDAGRQADIIARRAIIKRPPHRFLLALILNVLEWDQILAVVGEQFPDTPAADTVMEWIDQMIEIRDLGSKESNVLGISSDPDTLMALDGLLHKRPPETLLEGMSGEPLETILDPLRRSHLFGGLVRQYAPIQEALPTSDLTSCASSGVEEVPRGFEGRRY